MLSKSIANIGADNTIYNPIKLLTSTNCDHIVTK